MLQSQKHSALPRRAFICTTMFENGMGANCTSIEKKRSRIYIMVFLVKAGGTTYTLNYTFYKEPLIFKNKPLTRPTCRPDRPTCLRGLQHAMHQITQLHPASRPPLLTLTHTGTHTHTQSDSQTFTQSDRRVQPPGRWGGLPGAGGFWLICSGEQIFVVRQ